MLKQLIQSNFRLHVLSVYMTITTVIRVIGGSSLGNSKLYINNSILSITKLLELIFFIIKSMRLVTEINLYFSLENLVEKNKYKQTLLLDYTQLLFASVDGEMFSRGPRFGGVTWLLNWPITLPGGS